MQIGMQIVADITVFLNQSQRVLVKYKLLLKTVAVSRLVVGISDVANGNALAAILRTNPVGIGQIDADSRRGIFLTAEHGGTDDIGRNALDNRLTETGIDRRMILKPLGVFADGLGTMGGLLIDIFHESFPRAFQAQRIAIDLNESVDEIDGSIVLTHPFNAIFIENV